MSSLYPDLSFTTFPEQQDTIDIKSNITTSSDAQIVGQIQQYILNGDFLNASALLARNPDLQEKIFNANDFNKLRDAVIAMERFFLKDVYPFIEEQHKDWQKEIANLDYKGTYSDNVQYFQNNMVVFNNEGNVFLYICKETPIIGTDPTNTNYWQLMTAQGAQGESGDNFVFAYDWNSATTYNVGTVVVYSNKWWVSKKSGKNKEPSTNPEYWEEILEALPAQTIPITSSQPSGQATGDLWFKINS